MNVYVVIGETEGSFKILGVFSSMELAKECSRYSLETLRTVMKLKIDDERFNCLNFIKLEEALPCTI